MTIYIVTGLGFGDEGKGTICDHLARQAPSLVVRHNGGPQAGHNVVTPSGVHHTFSQFGSGTFAGAKTFLSYKMLINPLNMMREASSLTHPTKGQFNLWERTYVDEDCVIITPWHVAINRMLERARGDERHGSCGEGVGVATQQALALQGAVVRARDTTATKHDLRKILVDCRFELISTYADMIDASPEGEMLTDPDVIGYLCERYFAWKRKAKVVPTAHLTHLMKTHEQTIFEGAQGVLLDEWYGFHPYTTWSTTNHDNAIGLLVDYGPPEWEAALSTLGVIRSVTTRHGPGPLPTENAELTQLWKEAGHDPHNTSLTPSGLWQGDFRVGWLDLVLHRYALKVCGGVDQLAVTHLDFDSEVWGYCPKYEGLESGIQMPDKGDLQGAEINTGLLNTVAKPHLVQADTEQLLRAIEANLAPVTLQSYGPTANDKRVVVPA